MPTVYRIKEGKIRYARIFESHFFLYDEKGQVKIGVKTKEEAIAKHKETGLYITRVIDKS